MYEINCELNKSGDLLKNLYLEILLPDLEKPTNSTWYGYTKLVADALVQLESNYHLIVRTTHKEKPFPYSVAWEDQIGNFDYVDVTLHSAVLRMITSLTSDASTLNVRYIRIL